MLMYVSNQSVTAGVIPYKFTLLSYSTNILIYIMYFHIYIPNKTDKGNLKNSLELNYIYLSHLWQFICCFQVFYSIEIMINQFTSCKSV